MIKAEILEALPKLSAEERREIRAKLNELDNEAVFDNGELSGQEKAIIEARLDEYDSAPRAFTGRRHRGKNIHLRGAKSSPGS